LDGLRQFVQVSATSPPIVRRLIAVELHREAVANKTVIAVEVEVELLTVSEQILSVRSVFKDFHSYPQLVLVAWDRRRKKVISVIPPQKTTYLFDLPLLFGLPLEGNAG